MRAMFELLACKSSRRRRNWCWWCLERLSKGASCISLNLDAATHFKMHPTNPLEAAAAAILKQPPRSRRKLTYLHHYYLLATALLLNKLFSSSIPLTNSEAINESPLTDYDGASFYKATVGSRIRMACNGSHWATDETVSLVLWFKGPVEGHSVPIYTVDARQHSLGSGQARHLVADQYKGRARFTAASGSPPYLDLGPLEADDQAEYRCRIDYRTKPRENFLVILFVLVPPRSVDITDSTGRSLEQIYGPLSEDSDLTLLCLSKGGRPAPAIRWKRANKLIDDSYLTLNDFVALKRASSLLEAASSEAPSNNDTATTPPEEAPLTSTSSWLDWRHWPEFGYFSASSNASRRKHGQPGRKQSAGSGQHEQEREREREQEQEVSGHTGQLLTWPAEEWVTSSVNVLRLSSVNVRKLGPSYELGARLECEASNLFYDLRALIKLFAPASLLHGVGSGKLAVSRPLDEGCSQLELAIDQALDRALTSTSGGAHQLESASTAAAAATNSSTGPLMSRPAHGSVITNPASDKQQPRIVFQQLLERPHQLSATAFNSTTSVPTSAAPAAPQKAHRNSQQQDQLSLVRSRLITLDIYMRPLSVSISQLPAQKAAPRAGSSSGSSTLGSLSAGQLAEFSCSSSGSRPPAKLTWFKGAEPLAVRGTGERHFWDPTLGANSTDSKLTIRVERLDHGQQLTCRAENELLHQLLVQNHQLASQQAILEDSRTLSVQYPPQVKLELGNRALSRQVREGSDIFFVCHVDANPPVRDISWLHDQQPVNTSLPSKSPIGAPAGEGAVIVSNNSLVLQRVRVEQRGRYACASSNSEGYAESNQLELRVLHTPRCFLPAQQHQATTGAGNNWSSSTRLAAADTKAREEPVPVLLATRQVPVRGHTELECVVEADPPEVEISWFLESGAGGARRQVLSSAGAQVSTQTTTTTTTTTLSSSKLKYQVQSPLDYGRLLCLARNQLGEQRRACSWNIEPPDPSRVAPSCALLNVTDSSASAACSLLPSPPAQPTLNKANSISQQQQQLIVELYRRVGEPQGAEDDASSTSLEANLSAVLHPEEPYFEVSSLRPASRYTMLIRSLFGQPPAQLSFATAAALGPHSSRPATSGAATSGFRLEPQLRGSEPALSALISTRSAAPAPATDSGPDWTRQEQRGPSSGSSRLPAAGPDYSAANNSKLNSIWSWFREAVGLEPRPTGSDSPTVSNMSAWTPSGGAWQAGAQRDLVPAIEAAAAATNRMRPVWPINKPWEPSRWSSGGGTTAGGFQWLASGSFLACLLLAGLLAAILVLLLGHKYSRARGVGYICCSRHGPASSKGSASTGSAASYHSSQHQHQHQLLPLHAPHQTSEPAANPSSGPLFSMDSLDRAPPALNTKAMTRASTLDRANRRTLNSIHKSRSSFSFEAPPTLAPLTSTGSRQPLANNNELHSAAAAAAAGEQIFLTNSNKHCHLSRQQLAEPNQQRPEVGKLEQLGAPLHRLEQPNECDLLTMQLCQQILRAPPNQSAKEDPVSLIKSNQPLILTGQPQQAPVVVEEAEADMEGQHSDPRGCYQVSCLMHEQPFMDAAQFVPPSSSYLDERRHHHHWSTNAMARAAASGPLLLGQCEPANFMDQQMHFIELLPRHSSGADENSYPPPNSTQHRLHQQHCMDINLNFVNIVNGTQSMAADGHPDQATEDSQPLRDLSAGAQCSLTRCQLRQHRQHQQPPTYLGPNYNGSLDCPSLTSSASPSSSTFKDQSPLSLTNAGQSTVTTSTNYSTSELFPFGACSGPNYLAQLEQQQHQPDRLALSSLTQGDGKLLRSLSRPVTGGTQYPEEEQDDYSGLLVCAHNHQQNTTTSLQQTPITSILKTGNNMRRNPGGWKPPSKTVQQCPPDKLNEE